MTRYALVVGISEYRSKHLANLSKPEQDAEAIASLLRDYGGCEKVNVLKGYVSAEKLETALTTLITERAVKNEVIIYFTGHGFSTKGLGGKKGHLATSDCEIEMEAGQPKRQLKGIAFSDLNNLIQASNLSNLVMLLDTCHSGDFIESAMIEQGFSAFNTHQDYLLIAACRGFEEAWAKKSEAHSVFTGALLETLCADNADPDGRITGDRLFDYLSRATRGSRQELVRYGKGRSLPIVQFPTAEGTAQTSVPSASDTATSATRLSTVPLQMPPLPDHFVERPLEQQRVKDDLLCEGTKAGTLVVSAIYGLGGIGKSVLAAKLAREPDIQGYFSDGILWATLGQNPDILPLLSGWIQALGDSDYKPTAMESASNHLRTLLYDKRVLLVVDDVWNPEHLSPFRVGGEGSCVLVTTREARISGAHRHEIDVMSPQQSLELMTQKLSEPLNDTAKQQALSFAERVGHLPLALELAASQIEDGVTWQELFDDFQEEIVRLETLDVYGQTEIPDEQKRRKYSLLACFNLSLKQLSTEQLRQFAWLGVVPEDVSLTQEMAKTLWQVTSRQAGAILRAFRAKALVLQGSKQANERPSYRMHDLMHDLAQRLLTSPPQPQHEGELPGLGLTKAEAHSALLERYRKKTQKGQWHTLRNDGYIYAYLTWHMEQAKQLQEIHHLLQASNEDGRNGWYEACDAIGKPTGFVNDMGRAWTVAVRDYEHYPSRTISLLFRYALMRTSLNSLASNVPAALVEALVDKGVWQPAQGLAYAQQAQNPWQRAKCIAAIVSYMPKALLPEVLKTIRQIKDAVYRSYVLSKLAECFPQVWPEVLSAIQQIQDRYGNHREHTKGFPYRGLALKHIVQHLPSQHIDQALAIARQIQDDSDLAIALSALAEHRPQLWPEALSVTQEIKDESDRSYVLSELVEHLPAELLPEVVIVVRGIEDELQRIFALRTLVKYLPELLPEVLSITREIEDELQRTYSLSVLAKHSPELWPEAIRMMREIEQEFYLPFVLRLLAEHLPLKVWPEVLSVTREIKSETTRSNALSELADHLPTSLLPVALSIMQEIQNESARSPALVGLAKHMPVLWPEALSVTREIRDKRARSRVLVKLVEYLPSELLPETLSMIREINDEFARARTLSKLAEHLAELWSEVLSVTREINYEYSRASALRELAEHLPSDLRPKALDMAREIKDESSRAYAMRALAEYLPELWPEALDMVREIKDESSRTGALRSLAEHLPPELWPEALDMVREIKDESFWADALRELAAHLPPELRQEALDMTREIKDESSRAYTLQELAERLPPELWPEALDITREIKDESSRAGALSALMKSLPSELWPEALDMTREIKDESSLASALQELAEHLLPELWPEALDMTREIKDESSRASVLLALAENLPELWPEALGTIREIKDESSQAFVLCKLPRHLPTKLWPEALSIIREIKDESSQSYALRELAEHLPTELWPEILSITQDIKDESSRASALGAMKYLPTELWPEVLGIAQEIRDESSRAYALRALTDHLPSDLLPSIVEIAHSFEDGYFRANALESLLSRIEQLSIPFSEWKDILDDLAYQDRSNLIATLPAVRPTLIRLAGSKNVFLDILQSVRDVCQQWR